jgi:hypothetical protein
MNIRMIDKIQLVKRCMRMVQSGMCIILAAFLFTTPLSGQTSVSEIKNHFQVSDKDHHWVIGIEPENGITHFGIDSEASGRAETNLLTEPVKLSWDGSGVKRLAWKQVSENIFENSIKSAQGKGVVKWTVSENQGDMIWMIEYSGKEDILNLKIEIPVSSLQAAAVLISSKPDLTNHWPGPWLLVVPDYGQLMISSESDVQLLGINNGVRGSGSNAVSTGVDPRLRGQKWLEATGIKDFKAGKLNLKICTSEPLKNRQKIKLRFHTPDLLLPEGIESGLWEKIRRPYLNNWQPCGTWAGAKKEMVLSNNVLSDPASVSLSQYADPMLFMQKPVEGIDLSVLLKHSLEYYIDNEVSADGHVNAFGKLHDMYVSTGASVLNASWVYWTISNDKPWLEKIIQKLHLIADYLARRDIDNDGLIESIGSGNGGSLRDPDGADIWFEFMNFGFKNTWTNLVSYRAFLCLAEMLEVVNEHEGAAYYKRKAELLKQAFVKQFFSKENGWFVSWVSLDGKVHDYCHTFINGMAVSYGIVPPDQGEILMKKVVAKSKTIGFTNWHLGVPGNLIPARKEDMVGPRIGINGKPVKNDFYWPDGLTEAASFGNRYPNGTIHPALVWHYILGLQVAGLDEEADRILNAMIGSAQEGLFQNGIVNVGYGGAEHFYSNGKTCGYEGYLPESFNFLMACFTKNIKLRNKILHPMLPVNPGSAK